MTRRKQARVRRAINRWARVVSQREGGGAAGLHEWHRDIVSDWGVYPCGHSYNDGPRWSRDWGTA